MADDAAGPRMTRSSSKRKSSGDVVLPPMKTGLTKILGEASLEASSPSKKPKGGMHDKAQQKKWANKRDEIRAKRAMADAAIAAAEAEDS